jgi:hypothetical protein
MGIDQLAEFIPFASEPVEQILHPHDLLSEICDRSARSIEKILDPSAVGV